MNITPRERRESERSAWNSMVRDVASKVRTPAKAKTRTVYNECLGRWVTLR